MSLVYIHKMLVGFTGLLYDDLKYTLLAARTTVVSSNYGLYAEFRMTDVFMRRGTS
jgi:hypothetical protein